MAQNTFGRNLTFPIYNADGTSFHNLVLHKAVVDSVVMSLGDKITGDVYYKDNALDVTMHEYIMFKRNPNDENEDSVKYVLVSPPTIVREGMVSDNSELKGMTKYSFVFYHPMYVLNNIPFSDVAVTTEQERYLSQNKEFSWIGYPDDFIAKVNKNLQQTQWTVEKSSRFPNEKDSVLSGVLSFSNNTIADALKTWYDTWEIPYVIDVVKSGEQGYSDGKRFKIVFGLPSTEIYAQGNNSTPFVFQMGKGLGLKNNSRTPRNNKIITRISGYGSESNIPYGYPQIIWTGNQEWDYTINNASGMQTITVGGKTIQAMSYPIYDGIVGGQKVRLIKHPFTRTHLMPTVYSETVNKKVNPLNPNYNPNGEIVDYYDAVATQEYPYVNEIDPSAPSYEIHQFEDIKPEMNVGGENVEIVDAVPLNSDLTPADAWDDTMDDEGNYVQSFFRLDLPILPFDIYACASITEEMSINMRSGACMGCTFNVQVDWEDYKRNFYKDDGTFDPVIHTTSGDGHVRNGERYPDSSQTAISLIVQKDNKTFGTIMPNVYQKPYQGDKFVVLGISLPVEYITNAEETLDAETKSYMLENNVHYYDYPLKFDEYFLATHTAILSQIKPNAIVHFAFGDIAQPLELYVKQLTIKYEQGVLPQYDITLTDNIEVVLNQIGQVADDVEKLSSLLSIMREGYSRNVWNEIAKKLSKVSDDTARGKITFEKGAEFGKYNTGALGSGGAINIDQNGNSNAEFDFLTIRKAASFRTISILELKHVGGEMGLTAGAMKVSAVEELDDAYRCYFDTSDGTKQVYQEFVVGDQARCQQFRLAQNSSGMLTTKYYWRLVTGVGDNYVDLSKNDADTGSGVPQAGDEVIQLGYRNNDHPERQSAIILSAVASDAPSVKYYQGINSYNLTNVVVKDDGYDPTTGTFHTNTYGESYVGAKDKSTYMKYTPSGGVEIKGAVKMTSESTLDGNNLNTIINNISVVANGAQADADAAQDTADAAQTAANNANTSISNLSTGNENLVVNGCFTGLYQSDSVNDNTTVNADTQIFSDPWGRWDVHTGCSIVTSVVSATGVACQMSSGTLTQNIERGIILSQPYTLSLLALSTGTLNVSIGGWSGTLTLTNGRRCSVKFVALSTSATLTISGLATISEIQLIQGSVTINDWTPSPEDNNKYLSYYKNFAYLMAAIEQADTSILGGLVLTQQIRVGNYADHVMTQETGGMNGNFANDDSPFIWGGGSMTQAIATIAAYANDPTFQPTAQQLANMAKFIVTHGGRAILNDIIARGFIIATSGIFKNILTPNGNFRIDEQGNMSCQNATISGNMYAPFTRITRDNYQIYGELLSDGGYTQYNVNLVAAGFNIQIAEEIAKDLVISLPTDDKYYGALARIVNTSNANLYVRNIYVMSVVAVGDYYSETPIRWNQVIVPNRRMHVFQCLSLSSSWNVVTNGAVNDAQPRKIATVQDGDVLKISAGRTNGNKNYAIYGGTENAVNTSIVIVSETTYRVTDMVYTVPTNCTAIYAQSGGGEIQVSVYKRVSSSSYQGWANVSVGGMDRDIDEAKGTWRFENQFGVSVGNAPYIDGNGILRFADWYRTGDDGKIIHNE